MKLYRLALLATVSHAALSAHRRALWWLNRNRAFVQRSTPWER